MFLKLPLYLLESFHLLPYEIYVGNQDTETLRSGMKSIWNAVTRGFVAGAGIQSLIPAILTV